MERGFPFTAAAEKSLVEMSAWAPAGILTNLEDDELAALLALVKPPPRVVSLCAVRLRSGVSMVKGAFAVEAACAVRHFREQGLRSIFMLSLESEDNMEVTLVEKFTEIVQAPGGGSVALVEVAAPALLDDQDAAVTPVPQRLAEWLADLPRPCGVFCPQSGGGGYAIRVCRAIGLRVPEDISIIGVDDSDVGLASDPTLTTVTPVAEIIGFEAARVLDAMLSGSRKSGEIVEIDAMDLRVRESTGAQRARICDIGAAIRHIHQNFGSGLSVDSLHKATQQVSGKTFHTHFKLATGQTPGEAIRARQIEEARRLLSQTQLSITIIAEKSGFNSSSDFARRFRAIAGVPPSEYRLAFQPRDERPRL